jgi:hypothetical protein
MSGGRSGTLLAVPPPDAQPGDDRAHPEASADVPVFMRHRLGLTRPEERLPLPAWLRRTDGENRLPVAAAVILAAAAQLALPDQLTLGPRWLMPALELVLLATLSVANPVRLVREHPLLRVGSLALVVCLIVANSGSAVLLIRNVLNGHSSNSARTLFGNGAAIYLTNIVAFALCYWELDRDGPFSRAAARNNVPDFLFPQMATPEVADRDWEPYFFDYLYVSFTNATAFSPTDTMPLSRWAKLAMMVQSIVALATIGLVVARAVNVLR